MNALTMTRAIRWETWELSAESDRRFRRIVVLVALPILLIGLVVHLWTFPKTERGGGEFDGTQYVQLLPEAAEVAPPEEPKPSQQNSKEAPQEAKPAKPAVKPDSKPVTTVPTQSARDVASKSGVMQFADQLADLRDQNLSAVTTQQTLNSTISSKGGIGAAAGGSAADALAAAAASGSGGIGGNGTASVTTSQSGTGLGTRRTGAVKSPLGSGIDKSKAGASGDKLPSGRTLNEIKLTFDKNASPFYAIFNRASRENANIGRGTIRVSITIAPSGAVTSCTLVSSTYNDPDFERKVIERVKLVNFGAKDAPVFTIEYPIYFIPQ